MKDEPNVASKLQPPAQTETFLFASVMAVAWACVTTAGWAVLAVAFGRSKSNGRLLTMLLIGAIAVACLCNHAYRQGWRARR
jgi:hypothetical protein